MATWGDAGFTESKERKPWSIFNQNLLSENWSCIGLPESDTSASACLILAALRMGPIQFHASILVLLARPLCVEVSAPQDVICFGNSFAHRFDVPHGIFVGVARHGKGNVVFECPCWSGVGCMVELPSRARRLRCCHSFRNSVVASLFSKLRMGTW